jgi:hypothetical protein
MPETLYTYSIQTDTADGTALASCIAEEITNSSLETPGVNYVLTDGDEIQIYMTDTLSVGEETVLDSIVAAHTEENCGPVDGDHAKISVSENDTSEDYLAYKLNAREGLSSEITSDSDGAETLHFDLNINELSEDTAPDGTNDFVAFYDVSEGIHNKVKIDDLVSASSSASEQFSAVHTTGGANISSGWTDISLQTEHKKTSGFTHTALSAEVTLNVSGTYTIIGYLSTENSNHADDAGSRLRLVRDTGGGYLEVPGTRARMANDNEADDSNTGVFSVILDVNAGDKFKLQAERRIGSSTIITITDAGGLVFFTCGAQGPQGSQGIPGSGSSVTIHDEGSSVTGTPHTILDFVGSGVTVTNAGSGKATVTIPGSTASVFGSELQQVESDEESSTTSTSYQQKLRLTTNNLPLGTYRIGWQFSVFCSTSGDVLSKVVLDDTTDLDRHSIDNSTDEFNSNGGFAYRSSFSGVHTVDIVYKAVEGTALIRHARLEIWRVG